MTHDQDLETFLEFRDEAEDELDCPTCGGAALWLGDFGQLSHYRCRDCGWEFSRNWTQAFETALEVVGEL